MLLPMNCRQKNSSFQSISCYHFLIRLSHVTLIQIKLKGISVYIYPYFFFSKKMSFRITPKIRKTGKLSFTWICTKVGPTEPLLLFFLLLLMLLLLLLLSLPPKIDFLFGKSNFNGCPTMGSGFSMDFLFRT